MSMYFCWIFSQSVLNLTFCLIIYLHVDITYYFYTYFLFLFSLFLFPCCILFHYSLASVTASSVRHVYLQCMLSYTDIPEAFRINLFR